MTGQKPFRIYRIPFTCLTGSGTCERRCPTPSTPLHGPVIGDDEDDRRSPGTPRRCNDLRADMHLKVTEQPYTSRSCTASPTHHIG